jgi:hypothetical protein
VSLHWVASAIPGTELEAGHLASLKYTAINDQVITDMMEKRGPQPASPVTTYVSFLTVGTLVTPQSVPQQGSIPNTHHARILALASAHLGEAPTIPLAAYGLKATIESQGIDWGR